MKLKYRPEIDGLRSVAVISVIIYHCDIFFGDSQLLQGGFFGVDVFFVISGYLITSIIMGEYQRTGSFSITNFYERRVRRILPALFTVILVSLPFAWNLLLPEHLVDFSNSILSALIFASNFYWDSALQEYDVESALLQPFLHTWSLAVEEQYYIVFPLILMLLHRWVKKYLIAILAVGFLLSLQFAETMTAKDASLSFYMLPSRFWELLAGSLLACKQISAPRMLNNSMLNRNMPMLGMLLILYAVCFVDFQSNHPGYITLLPVIGTILIIWFGNANESVTRVLSSKVFVAIGLISYSLYLWHYPIFAFGRYLDSSPTWHDKTQWVVLSFILSIATYRFIEKPFRNKTKMPRKKLFVWLATAFVAISATTVVWSENSGFDNRLGYLNSLLKNAERVWVSKDNQKCHAGGGGRNPAFPLRDSCVFEYHEGAKYIVLVGDSQAGSIAEKVRLLAKENSYNFVQLTSAGCFHLKGFVQHQSCNQRSRRLLSFLQQYSKPIIIYKSRVPWLLEIERFSSPSGDREANYKPVAAEKVKKQFPHRSKALTDTLNELSNVAEKLVIIYPVPEQGFDVEDKLFAKKKHLTSKEDLPVISTSYKVFKARVKRSNETLSKVAGENVINVYPETIFCHDKTGRCIVSDKDKLYFERDNHVSPLGASMIVAQIAKKLGL